MWKHCLIAASFDHVFATLVVPTIDRADELVNPLIASLVNAAQANSESIESSVGDAQVLAGVGISGHINVTAKNPEQFYSDRVERGADLQSWLAGHLGLPAEKVVVTIPAAAVAPLTPAAAAETAAAAATLRRMTAPALAPLAPASAPALAPILPGSPVVGDDVAVPADPIPGVVPVTFVVTLPPGKTEISTRLADTPPADVLASFSSHLGAGVVTSAAVTMNSLVNAASSLSGTVLLAVADTSSAGIESTENQEAIRRSIADIAFVYFGDVGQITFSSVAGAAPLEAAEPAETDTPDASAGSGTEEVVQNRRLTAGQVNAAFTISVPGFAAQGYQKDCSMNHVQATALQPVEDTAGVTTLNTFSVTPPTCDDGNCPEVTLQTCANAANLRNAELWSFTDVDGVDNNECRMSDWALLSSATYVPGAVTQVGDGGCGDCPTPTPVGTWPGENADASNAAFGVMQPFGLQCWPRNDALVLMNCGFTTVQSTVDGWPGTCNNLLANAAATTQAACQAACQQDPFCSVWMWATPQDTADDDATAACFAGVGNQCWTEMEGRSSIGNVLMAERVQHGVVNVIKADLNTLVIDGLQKQFGENVQKDGVALSLEAQRDNCRITCHSNIECTFWQSYYSDGTSSDRGCWIEAPGVDASGAGTNTGGFVQYPTTVAVYRQADPDTDFITGGEYIQHYCPIPSLPSRPAATTTTTTTTTNEVVAAAVIPTATPAPPGGFPTWGFVLIGLCLVAAVAAVAFFLLQNQKKPQAKKASRGVKPIKVKETPPPPALPAPPLPPLVPLMAQQIMVQSTIPRPLTMTTIQQPTTIAAQAIAQPMAPLQMATYAGAPQLVQRPY